MSNEENTRQVRSSLSPVLLSIALSLVIVTIFAISSIAQSRVDSSNQCLAQITKLADILKIDLDQKAFDATDHDGIIVVPQASSPEVIVPPENSQDDIVVLPANRTDGGDYILSGAEHDIVETMLLSAQLEARQKNSELCQSIKTTIVSYLQSAVE